MFTFSGKGIASGIFCALSLESHTINQALLCGVYKRRVWCVQLSSLSYTGVGHASPCNPIVTLWGSSISVMPQENDLTFLVYMVSVARRLLCQPDSSSCQLLVYLESSKALARALKLTKSYLELQGFIS